MDFYKGIIPKAFDLEQVIYDHRQVGQPKKKDPERLASISDNSVLNAFISSSPRKLNYRRLEEGMIIFIYFYFVKKNPLFFNIYF